MNKIIKLYKSKLFQYFIRIAVFLIVFVVFDILKTSYENPSGIVNIVMTLIESIFLNFKISILNIRIEILKIMNILLASLTLEKISILAFWLFIAIYFVKIATKPILVFTGKIFQFFWKIFSWWTSEP